MEKTTLGTVIPLNAGWRDIGSWDQLWDYSTKDKFGNTKKGNVVLENSKNCLFRGEERLMVGINLEDIIVVETNDAILVLNKNATKELKVVQNLKRNKHKEGFEILKSIDHGDISLHWLKIRNGK